MQSSFSELGLSGNVVAIARKRGFKEPTPIQDLVIPEILAGRDLVVEAKTGSGKTLCYGLPLLNRPRTADRGAEALVIVPTRELARQIERALTPLAEALQRRVVAAYGGGRLDKQIQLLNQGPAIVVGTPGRLKELFCVMRTDGCRYLVLDEVDELLLRGFADDLAELESQLPNKRQTLLFSATVPHSVELIAKSFCQKPKRLSLTVARELPEEIDHQVLLTTTEQRIDDLVTWLKLERPYQAIIFCGSKKEGDDVTTALGSKGLDVEFFHGDLSQAKRDRLLSRFRSGDLPYLVATDIAARGLDLPGITHVVNYSLPLGVPAYIHRVGRTGRAGKKGVALSLIIGQQQDRLERLRHTFRFRSVTLAKDGLRHRDWTTTPKQRRSKPGEPKVP